MVEGDRRKKVTDRQVRRIRMLKEEGWTYKALAKKYRVHPQTIYMIVKWRRRRDV